MSYETELNEMLTASEGRIRYWEARTAVYRKALRDVADVLSSDRFGYIEKDYEAAAAEALSIAQEVLEE